MKRFGKEARRWISQGEVPENEAGTREEQSKENVVQLSSTYHTMARWKGGGGGVPFPPPEERDG